LVAVGFGEPHPFAAAGLVERLDRRRAGRPRDAFEIILARRVIGEADEFRRALLGDMDVVDGIAAAHIERRLGALGAYQPEAREEFLHEVEIGCAEPTVGHVRYFDARHISHPKFRSWKKSLPLSSITLKAGKFSTSIFHTASMPSSGYSTVSTFLMQCSARFAAAPPIEARKKPPFFGKASRAAGERLPSASITREPPAAWKSATNESMRPAVVGPKAPEA